MKSNLNNQPATKNDLKELRNELKEDFKNHTGFLLEQFSDQVKVVAEQQVDINRNLTGIKKHLGHVDQRLDKLEIKTEVLMETVADVKVDTTMIREELGSKTDKSEHKKLEHRVAVLESRA